jgi:hypothetical protein
MTGSSGRTRSASRVATPDKGHLGDRQHERSARASAARQRLGMAGLAGLGHSQSRRASRRGDRLGVGRLGTAAPLGRPFVVGGAPKLPARHPHGQGHERRNDRGHDLWTVGHRPCHDDGNDRIVRLVGQPLLRSSGASFQPSGDMTLGRPLNASHRLTAKLMKCLIEFPDRRSSSRSLCLVLAKAVLNSSVHWCQ